MNISVSADDLSFVGCISHEWGLPVPQNEGEDELFGPYSTNENDGFLKYDGQSRTWSKLTQLNSNYQVSETDLDACSLEELDELRYVITEINWAPPPRLPDDRAKQVMDKPFNFGRWRLAWLYVPQLKRWELAPLGRR